MRRNLHSRLGGEASGQAQVRRSLLAGVSAASLALLAALAAAGPARAPSLGGVGGAGLNPGGNGGGSNQNGGNGSTGATFGAKGSGTGGAGQPGTTGMGPTSANASGGGGGGAVGDTGSSVTGGAGGAGGTGVVGGAGGAGGIGVLITGNGTTNSNVVNQLCDSIGGGAGGAGAAAGLDGAGVSGSYLTVENLGAINGGGANGDAIDFNAGTNTLSLGASQSMTGAVHVASGATLTIDQTILGANGNLTNTLAGAGAVSINTGANTLTLSGDNTYTGGTTIMANSTVIVGNSNAFGTNTVAMGNLTSLNFTGGVGIGNAITVTGDPDFNAAPATTSVISGAITGTGSVTINNTAGNTGTIEFTSTGNAYTGSTTVEAGELMGGVAGAFSAASATTVDDGATLDLGGFAQTINSVTLDQGTIQNGSLTGAISSAGGTVNGSAGRPRWRRQPPSGRR
jgi:fibronectin-binding autotransporter adhesin